MSANGCGLSVSPNPNYSRTYETPRVGGYTGSLVRPGESCRKGDKEESRAAHPTPKILGGPSLPNGSASAATPQTAANDDPHACTSTSPILPESFVQRKYADAWCSPAARPR